MKVEVNLKTLFLTKVKIDNLNFIILNLVKDKVILVFLIL